MHSTRKLFVRLLGLVTIFLFFFGTPLVSAFFARYVVSNSSVVATLDSLESTTTPLGISLDIAFNSYFDWAEGGAVYKIDRLHFCELYDDNDNCIDEVQDLCPYVSVAPNTNDGTAESTEIARTPDQNDPVKIANGEINSADDLVDNWEVKIKSPCFEGECPADYDSLVNGSPLPQSLKGKTFNCELYVESAQPPILVQDIIKSNTAYAATFNQMSLNIVFTGVYTPPVTGSSNVLFIPGLEASRLYKEKSILGFTVEDQLWEPNTNGDAVDLYMNSDGTSVNPNIYAKEIIDETNIPLPTGFISPNIYKSFSSMLDGLVSSGDIIAWQPYAYDWRQGVQDIVDNGTQLRDGKYTLTSAISSLSSASKSGKVTIIAHSNGGLIAKALLKKLSEDKTAGRNSLIDKIDKVILVASPQLGTPSAVPAILHGYDQDINPFYIYPFMNRSSARELGRNMPSAYGLLPSAEYYNHVSNPVVSFLPNLFDPYITNEINNYGQNISSYNGQKNFMIGTDGRSDPAISNVLKPIKAQQNLISEAETLHSSIDNFVIPSSIKVIQIAGWGLDTISGFQYNTNSVCPSTSYSGCIGVYALDETPIFTSDGDKTVVTPSALATDGEKWWLNLPLSNRGVLNKDHKHADILEVPSLLDFIFNRIKDLEINPTVYLSTSTPVDILDKLRLSVHSPVSLDAYDAFGNHTGKVCPAGSSNCYIEENIPNSSYYEFGEGKYINLPKDDFQKVDLQGTDVGTFTYNSTVVDSGGQQTTSSFVDIPVTTQTQGEITLDQTGVPQIKLDVTGDGVTDFTLKPAATFDPIVYLQIMKTTVDSLDISKDKKESFDKKIEKIIKSLQKSKTSKALSAIDSFKQNLQKTLSKPDPKKSKSKKLSKSDAQMLLDMLNKLLDNLS